MGRSKAIDRIDILGEIKSSDYPITYERLSEERFEVGYILSLLREIKCYPGGESITVFYLDGNTGTSPKYRMNDLLGSGFPRKLILDTDNKKQVYNLARLIYACFCIHRDPLEQSDHRRKATLMKRTNGYAYPEIRAELDKLIYQAAEIGEEDRKLLERYGINWNIS